ncbi:MAG: phenylacetate--CoA ligase [Oscillospiraceae bacterium]
MKSPYYSAKFSGISADEIQTQADFEQLPFSDKADLRNAYPLGLQAVPNEEIIRIHSSSGTTGQAVIIPYTRRDVENWSIMMARCFEMSGLTKTDRVQITPGYGLWTAGIGFQAGCERLGAMCIPTGPGNTERQLKMMLDLKTTAIAATSSYALILAEQIEKQNLREHLALRCGIIGSERWSAKMRQRIEKGLGIELFDIYGLTECYGPGIANECHYHDGLHYFDDFVYFEVIDPSTGQVLPQGETGELVITTLCKEGAPLIRYRTHDLTHLITDPCPCGSAFPRHGRIIGRTDDMIKIKGTNIFPAQVDMLLGSVAGASSEYRLRLDRKEGRDRLTVLFECEQDADNVAVTHQVIAAFKSQIGIKVEALPYPIGGLERSEKKTQRVIDERNV